MTRVANSSSAVAHDGHGVVPRGDDARTTSDAAAAGDVVSDGLGALHAVGPASVTSAVLSRSSTRATSTLTPQASAPTFAAPSTALSAPQPPQIDTTSVNSGYIPTLDGWRAIAIVLVIIAHARFGLFGPDGRWPHEKLDEALSYAVVGVPIFFGISGLLICSRLLDEERIAGRISLRGFYVRRLFRILPPYFLVIGAIALLGALRSVEIPSGDLLSAVFFFRNYWPTHAESAWYTNHFWSLSVEEHFYLILPCLLVALGRRKALGAIVALALTVVVWRAFQRHTHILSDEMRFLTYRTDINLDGLFLGAAAAFALQSQAWSAWIGRHVGSAAVVACFASLGLANWFHLPSVHTFVALVVPVMLLGTVLRPQSIVSLWLEAPWLRWIGRMSYSLYLWQQLFLTPIKVPFMSVPVPHLLPAWMQTLPWSLVGVFACALASYNLVEKPLTRWGRRIARPTTAGRAL